MCPDLRRAGSGGDEGDSGRLVHAVLRGPDLHGLRHREHGLDRPRIASDHRVHPGGRFPRPVLSADPRDRDVCRSPHSAPGSDFTTVGDIFSLERNGDRKKPFDIRTVMRAVVDQDHSVLERWAGMADADTSVVFDAHLGGHPVTVIGIESKPVPRKGYLPKDGPDIWTGGTLFPQS